MTQKQRSDLSCGSGASRVGGVQGSWCDLGSPASLHFCDVEFMLSSDLGFQHFWHLPMTSCSPLCSLAPAKAGRGPEEI